MRHDGLIFAVGLLHAPIRMPSPPAWKGADQRDYTVTYVEQAIARYERDGVGGDEALLQQRGEF